MGVSGEFCCKLRKCQLGVKAWRPQGGVGWWLRGRRLLSMRARGWATQMRNFSYLIFRTRSRDLFFHHHLSRREGKKRGESERGESMCPDFRYIFHRASLPSTLCLWGPVLSPIRRPFKNTTSTALPRNGPFLLSSRVTHFPYSNRCRVGRFKLNKKCFTTPTPSEVLAQQQVLKIFLGSSTGLCVISDN